MNIVGLGNCGVNYILKYNKSKICKNKINTYIDERVRSDFLLDHLAIGSFTLTELKNIIDFSKITSRSILNYMNNQIERKSLACKNPELIVIDNWGDMFFTAWECKITHRKLWISNGDDNLTYVKNKNWFCENFKSCGYLDYDTSVHNYIQLIEYYRRYNKECPVLFGNIYTHLWKPDFQRSFYEKIMFDVKQQVKNCFIATIDKQKVKPANPKNKLHFVPENYIEMFNNSKLLTM